MRWTDTPIHIIDFEGSIASGILEYGIVTLLGGGIAMTQTRLCRATGRVRDEDAALHGLTAGLVARCEPFATAEEFSFFARLRETGPLGAHFAHAENSLLKSAWPYPRRSPDFARGAAAGNGGNDANATTIDWGPWIDTGRLYAEIFPHSQLETLQLESLVRVFDLQAGLDAIAAAQCPANRRHYHAALYDALASALLLISLGRRAEFSEMTVPWLLQMSAGSAQKRDALRQEEMF